MRTFFLIMLVVTFIGKIIKGIKLTITDMENHDYDTNVLIGDILGILVGSCLSMSMWVIVYIKLFY
ncbi:MAG: hypothetical protein VZR09_10255 [Candidatus Gastranaerophilaceae bacterium]|nr:hypothetical protein [Candidatus Gastranaerophilaceae bacterium]